jgi:hypothetical protein
MNPFRYDEMVPGETYTCGDFVDLRSFYASDFYRSF